MNNSEDRINDPAEKAAEAAFEYEIAKDTRAFLESLDQEQVKMIKPSKRVFYWTGIAAAMLVLIISMITITQSHNDSAIAGNFGINQIVARSSTTPVNPELTDAIQAYYGQNYRQARSIISELDPQTDLEADYIDWLDLLIALQTTGSDSETFNNKLDEILVDENHEFHEQAIKMKQDLSVFWRFLIF